MKDKKQIIIDGVDVSRCILRSRKEPNCTVCNGYSSKVFEFDCSDFKNCEFKQLARKTQECDDLLEQHKELDDRANRLIEEKYNLSRECEELKKQLKTSEKWRIAAESLNEKLELRNTRYRKALEEIEKIARNGLSPICYKSNCSCCRCYNGDDCNASMTSLINNYFTKNGDFVDENCDFVEALEGLLEDERKKCNKARPIVQQILDIINKAKGEG